MKKNFFRIFYFIFRNLKNPFYLMRYIYAFPQSIFQNNASFFTEEELITELKNGKSLLRYGDGEIYMMNFGSIPQYEPYNKNLRNYLFKIIKNYKPTSSYIIGIPIFVNTPNYELRATGKINVWLPLKIFYHFIFPHNVKYFDAHLFYRNGGFDRSLNFIFKKYKIVIVTCLNNIKLMKDSNIENKINITFLETPERESFKIIPELLQKIISHVGNDKENYRVVLATGPASKILVYELSKIGIISYDIGRGIETVYRKNEIEYLI